MAHLPPSKISVFSLIFAKWYSTLFCISFGRLDKTEFKSDSKSANDEGKSPRRFYYRYGYMYIFTCMYVSLSTSIYIIAGTKQYI